MTLHRFPHSATARITASLALLLLAAPVAGAQSSGRGFLFSEPRWTLALRGGFDRAIAGSDLFEYMTDTLTLDRSDFSGFTFGADLAYAISPRFDIAVGAGYTRAETTSEYVEYIGTDDLPINQTTTFSRFPLTATARVYLNPRGRSIGSLAWVPARFSPYAGIGGGMLNYEFRQEGEFVETEEGSDVYRIVSDNIVDSGWTPTAHGMVGAEFSLTPRLGLSTEGRYVWARSDLDPRAFEGFDPIDLSGFSATMGFIIRF